MPTSTLFKILLAAALVPTLNLYPQAPKLFCHWRPVLIGTAVALLAGLTILEHVLLIPWTLTVILFRIKSRFFPPVPGGLLFSKGTKPLLISEWYTPLSQSVTLYKV